MPTVDTRRINRQTALIAAATLVAAAQGATPNTEETINVANRLLAWLDSQEDQGTGIGRPTPS